MIRRKLVRKTKFKKLVRTKFPVKNCYIMMDSLPNYYFANEHLYSNIMYLMTKNKALNIHKKLKELYYVKFRVVIKTNNATRVLIKE